MLYLLLLTLFWLFRELCYFLTYVGVLVRLSKEDVVAVMNADEYYTSRQIRQRLAIAMGVQKWRVSITIIERILHELYLMGCVEQLKIHSVDCHDGFVDVEIFYKLTGKPWRRKRSSVARNPVFPPVTNCLCTENAEVFYAHFLYLLV